jgi:hypothetical protein
MSLVQSLHFRVPKSAMLSRSAEVPGETGALNSRNHPAIVCGWLRSIRAQTTLHARLVLVRAVTVAVRHCAIRRRLHDRQQTSEREFWTIERYTFASCHFQIPPLRYILRGITCTTCVCVVARRLRVAMSDRWRSCTARAAAEELMHYAGC